VDAVDGLTGDVHLSAGVSELGAEFGDGLQGAGKVSCGLAVCARDLGRAGFCEG